MGAKKEGPSLVVRDAKKSLYALVEKARRGEATAIHQRQGGPVAYLMPAAIVDALLAVAPHLTAETGAAAERVARLAQRLAETLPQAQPRKED